MGELEKYNVAVDKDAMSLEGDTGVSSDDALRLAQLGHTQELRRQYSLFSLCALCVCLMATWEALSSVVATALITGGAPCLFYNYLLSAVCSICIASSLGEIASIYPTAGGQYHWVAALAPASIRSTASWVTGWVSIGGQVVLTSSAAFAAGLQMQALIIVNNETYVPERWQGMLFYWLVLVYALALNIWGDRLLPYTNTVSGAIHVIGFVTIVVVLGVMAPKNSASFVFTEVTNSSGWSNDGVSWLVGLLSAVYPFLGYDAACHLAEEMPHASRNVPLAMVGSVTVNGLMGLVYVIIFLFSTGPLEKLLATPTGFPFMQIFLDATKSQAGCTVLSVIITCTAVAATVAGVTSTSRTLWAFARDKSTPFDKQLSKVDKRLQIPVYAVVVVTVLQMLLGLIYLGNTTAFNAILSMSIIGMYVSYAFPIIAMLFARKSLQTPNGFGPFKLGHIAGPAANVISLIWITVVVIFSTFPSAMPVTPQNMNYSIVVMAGWLFAGIAYYVFRGKHKFEVPVVDLDVVEGLRDGVHDK
ncbi:Choline transport protein [Fusarium oxysporum f. sp. cubense race 1]|uniref:Choline transport protein n=1 Tax=Fusarium oxysporum f. sp. cubense (strain race 1) TaxID=1229664 RepID=N4UK73_FUSC1|nr:Choline transport protein [Fusarium oxysporum f. sp. cubense race 1]